MQLRQHLANLIRQIHQPALSLLALAIVITLGHSTRVFCQGNLPSPDGVAPTTIRIWKVGSPHNGNLPDNRLPSELVARAAKLDLHLDLSVMLARDLRSSLATALKANDEPDILVIDNFGLILGITTVLGRFEGIGRNYKPGFSLVGVTESLRSLQTSGWEFLIPSARNYQKARALAQSGEKCNPQYSDKGGSWRTEATPEILELAETATAAYFKNDQAALDHLVGGRYADDSLAVTGRQNEISKVEVCGGWGNNRLAFVHTVAALESKDLLGFESLLLVAAKSGGHWQLLSLGRGSDIAKKLQARVRLLAPGSAPDVSLQVPSLVAPVDQAYFKRWPAEERPLVEWTTAGVGAVTYLLEWQYQSRRLWYGSVFEIADGTEANGPTIKLKATFGIGMQPHRWRIWAIGEGGEVARSEWRVVNYLD